jgi:hypothetical protein
MVGYRDPYLEIKRKAMQAFEHPDVPPAYGRPSDLFAIAEGDGYTNWDTLHVWIDDEQHTALARRIFWRSLFDTKRFTDSGMAARYGQNETPSLVITDYAPPYEAMQTYWMALLGAIPAEALSEENYTSSRALHLRLRLPLGDLDMICDSYEGGWDTLIETYRELHQWVLTTPRLSSTLKS